MKLSVYLLRDSVKKFKDAIQEKCLKGKAAFTELPTTEALPYPCRAYLQSNKSSRPKWVSFLDGHFDTDSLHLVNQSSSFVLLLKSAGRRFAVTFGYGFQALDRSKIEPRFGLMVAANCMNELSGVETNLIDTLTQNKKLQMSKATKVSEFGLNHHVDWIRRLSGTPTSPNIAKKMSGSDSCCIGVDCDLESLGAKCSDLLELYESEGYKEGFEFIDHLQPIGKKDPAIENLELQLVQRLTDRETDRLSIAFPEVPDDELLDHFRVWSGHTSVDMPELELSAMYEFLDENDIEPDPADIHIIGIDGNDNAVTKARTLRDYLACEFDEGGNTYIFCHGDWFKADQDYVEQIRKEVAALDDISDDLDLLPVEDQETEGEYNARLADEKGYVLLDKASFKIGNSYDKIEICDMLSPETDLICIKKMNDSSSLSHLFGQGSVSATLLREVEAYREKVNEVASDQWDDFEELDKDNLSSRARIVFGIATRKEEPLSEGMFFFSMVNLLTHVRQIRLVGCDVALCKIGYVAAAASPTPTKKKKAKVKAKVKAKA